MDKIVCVGKNYAEHAKELGEKLPEKPVVFIKPPSILLSCQRPGEKVRASLPSKVGSVHHETEIVLRIGKAGVRVNPSQAEEMVSHVSLGLDMTLRDRQLTQKKNGHPWTTSKVFLHSAIVGPWIQLKAFSRPWETEFQLKLNGETRQQATAKEMLFSPFEVVSYLSEFFPLCEGDVIFTGTPKGVGQVAHDDNAELTWGNINYSVAWEEDEF